jgi:tRNA dimethylallyltransferase
MASPGRHPFPVIIGPTAGGKSALAVGLAHLLGPDRCAVLAADAFQIYRGMDIGTAKPTLEERNGVEHLLIDLREPTERFTVHQWLDLAERTIADVRARGGTPIVVGGTNLYVKSLLDGLFEGPEPDEALRDTLRAMTQAQRREELECVDPEAADKIERNDERRTVRALEVFRLTGTPISRLQQQWDSGRTRHDCVLVGLDWPVPEINRRINARVKQMMEQGLLDECARLLREGRLGVQAREALGYKQLIEHLEGRGSLEEAVERIKIDTRRFAKQQRTWLRRIRTTAGVRTLWIDAGALPSTDWPGMAATFLGAGA